MFCTLERATPEDHLRADVVIVGGGLAGLCLAETLASSRCRVLILESGVDRSDSIADELNAGHARLVAQGQVRKFDEYLVQSRQRSLGGSGNLWGGKCAILEPHDFQARPWIAHSGWPLSFRDLAPAYAQASQYLGIPHLHAGVGGPRPDRPSLPADPAGYFQTSTRVFSGLTGADPGERFDALKNRVATNPNVCICLGATAKEIVCEQSGEAVAGVSVVDRSADVTRMARGRAYILAGGGLENPRLLLVSDTHHASGIGNATDQVGRYYGGHFVFKHCAQNGRGPIEVRFRDPSTVSFYADKAPDQSHGVLTLTRKGQLRERLPGFSVSFEQRHGASTQVPAFFMVEQPPDPSSRVQLGRARDRYGVPVLSVDWQLPAADVEHLRKAVGLFERYLDRTNAGLMVGGDDLVFDAISNAEFSRHHTGTTRMSADETTGVVDTDCRVHGIRNLYAAGTSVFPTAGLANPTLTLLALAFRLADAIKQQLMSESMNTRKRVGESA